MDVEFDVHDDGYEIMSWHDIAEGHGGPHYYITAHTATRWPARVTSRLDNTNITIHFIFVSPQRGRRTPH